MIDIAIIGAGPAGLSAAVNAAARNRTVAVFGRKKETSNLYKAEKVNNHLGMQNKTGKEILDLFYQHVKELDIPVHEGRVMQIIPMGDSFSINFDNEFLEARSIILALGITKGGTITGEAEYLGRGVSYCATCDGMLYKGKNVLVIGEIEEAVEDAKFLSGICDSVTYVSKHKPEHLEINFVAGKPTEVLGDDVVTGVVVNGETLLCDAAFFVKAATPIEQLVYGLDSSEGYINVNRLMETNVKGLFACGDCTGWPYQLSNAIGEGLVAAQQADRYLK